MNYPLLRYLFGMILLIVAAFLVLPLAVAVIYGESSGIYFLYTMIAAGLLGFLLTRFKPAKRDMYAREGFVFTALAWVVISLIGAAPFTLSGQIPSYLDAVFETVSGFTTTGASILTDVEALDNGMLFWRSFTHWLGGMGILVFMLSLVNMGGPPAPGGKPRPHREQDGAEHAQIRRHSLRHLHRHDGGGGGAAAHWRNAPV